jgi:P-type Ca2+ transporter type 2C
MIPVQGFRECRLQPAVWAPSNPSEPARPSPQQMGSTPGPSTARQKSSAAYTPVTRFCGHSSCPALLRMTGPEVAAMDEQTLRDRVASSSVFGRAVPEQKLQLVNALKVNGEIVAMTGNGMNDSPALKAAHIGIAMGERGTDVAREAADLVLLKDDFSSIVQAVRLGRRIFDNLRKATAYAFAIHAPIAGLSFIPVLFRWPLILQPVHVAFLELIIDASCSIVFEAEEAEVDVMERPPRCAAERLFSGRMVTMSLLQGFGLLILLLAIFAVACIGDRARQMLVL